MTNEPRIDLGPAIKASRAPGGPLWRSTLKWAEDVRKGAARLRYSLRPMLGRRSAAFLLFTAAEDGAGSQTPARVLEQVLGRSRLTAGLGEGRRRALRERLASKSRPAEREELVRFAAESLDLGWRPSAFIAAADIICADVIVPRAKQEFLERLSGYLGLKEEDARRWVVRLREKHVPVRGQAEAGILAAALRGMPGALTPDQAVYALILCALLADDHKRVIAPLELQRLSLTFPEFRDLSDAAFRDLHSCVADRAKKDLVGLQADAEETLPIHLLYPAFLQVADAVFGFGAPGDRARMHIDKMAERFALTPDERIDALELIQLKYGL